jgi:hypothetical protein
MGRSGALAAFHACPDLIRALLEIVGIDPSPPVSCRALPYTLGGTRSFIRLAILVSH